MAIRCEVITLQLSKLQSPLDASLLSKWKSARQHESIKSIDAYHVNSHEDPVRNDDSTLLLAMVSN